MAPSLFLLGDPALDGEVIRNLFAALSSASSLAVLVSIGGGPAVGTASWYTNPSQDRTAALGLAATLHHPQGVVTLHSLMSSRSLS